MSRYKTVVLVRGGGGGRETYNAQHELEITFGHIASHDDITD